MRNTDYQFVDTDSVGIEAKLISAYEHITRRSLNPADPDRLFISWVADIITNERVNQNFIGNQNIPSRAVGENLDALGETIFNVKRPAAQDSYTTVRFHISKEQTVPVSIPRGTRVTGINSALVWATTKDAYIEPGATYADVMAQCETPGDVGNGQALGQINTLIDIDNIKYYQSCENISESDGGAERATDEEYYELMKKGLSSFTTAGSTASYEYWAKSVSNHIADVKAVQPNKHIEQELALIKCTDGHSYAFYGGEEINLSSLLVRALVVDDDGTPALSEAPGGLTQGTKDQDYTVKAENGMLIIDILPTGEFRNSTSIVASFYQRKAGEVYIYVLMDDGEQAGEVIKGTVLNVCNQEFVRPMTDRVSVKDPANYPYDIEFTYYVDPDSQVSVSFVEAAVDNTVKEYIAWQRQKFNRDVDPSELIARLKRIEGIKRVSLARPIYASLKPEADNTPVIARVSSVDYANGGYE